MLIKKHSSFIVFVILSVFFAVSILVSSQESNTYDERAHIPSAYTYVKYGDMRINPEHPPLIKDLAGLPLLFLHLNFPINDPLWTDGLNEQWSLGEKFLYESDNNPDLINFWSRLPIILLSIILGIFIYLWTKELAGTSAGIFALILYAADPNIIAHNHYVTTDIGIAAMIFISTYFFVHFLKSPTLKNTLIAGIFLGLVQVTKFSAVLLFPIFGLLAMLYATTKISIKKDDGTQQTKPISNFFEYILKYSGIVFISFIVIFVFYVANTYNMPPEKTSAIANWWFKDTGPGILAKSIVAHVTALPVLHYFNTYALGVLMVIGRVAGGNTHYFLGRVDTEASAEYFPLVFLLKETIPFLFLLLASLVYTIIRIYKAFLQSKESGGWLKVISRSIPNRIAQYSMASFVLIYAYLSITGNLNIGFRHLFPILPFLYVLTAKTVFDFIKRRNEHCSTLPSFNAPCRYFHQTFSILSGVFVFWIIAIPVLNYPYYLSYFNETIGGHKQGYQYVTDSNYDWGQDLEHLQIWIEQYNNCTDQENTFTSCISNISQLEASSSDVPKQTIDKIRIDYFGGANAQYYFGDAMIPWWEARTPEAGWYAISATFFQESLYKNRADGSTGYRWISQYKPVGRAGDSIFIFYVNPESLSNK